MGDHEKVYFSAGISASKWSATTNCVMLRPKYVLQSTAHSKSAKWKIEKSIKQRCGRRTEWTIQPFCDLVREKDGVEYSTSCGNISVGGAVVTRSYNRRQIRASRSRQPRELLDINDWV